MEMDAALTPALLAAILVVVLLVAAAISAAFYLGVRLGAKIYSRGYMRQSLDGPKPNSIDAHYTESPGAGGGSGGGGGGGGGGGDDIKLPAGYRGIKMEPDKTKPGEWVLRDVTTGELIQGDTTDDTAHVDWPT